MASEEQTYPETKNSFGIWFVLLSPIVSLLYFLQLDQAFVGSIDSVLESARLERELYLVPRSGLAAWGDHYIYRFVSGCVSVAFATFVCGGLSRDRGKWAGLIGGITIAVLVGFFLFIVLYSEHRLVASTGHVVVSAILMFVSPVIGWFAGIAGEEASRIKPSGFAGIPRVHFLWLWIPLYFYGLLLIGPIVNLVTTDSMFSVIAYLKALLPVVLFGAPVLFGLLVMSGDVLQKVPNYIRQVIGPVVIIGGVFVLSLLIYWLHTARLI